MNKITDIPQCFDPSLDLRTNQLIPVRCLTCGAVLGHHQEPFEKLLARQKMERIRNDPVTVQSLLVDLDPEDKTTRIQRLRAHRAERKESVESQHQERVEFLEKRNIRRVCCRTTFLTRPQPENASEKRL